MGGTGLREDVQDLLPDAGHAPANIAPVHGFPGTALGGEFPPRIARLDDPENTGEDQAVVGIRPPGLGLLRWEQARNASPVLLRQLQFVCAQRLDGGRPERWSLLLASTSGMTCFGHGLVLSAKGRPVQAET